MANNRLTWRDVTSPNYSGVSQGFYQANKMFQDALGGLSTSLGDFATNRKNAQDEALLKQQQEAEGAYLRQLASVLGDTEREEAVRRSLSGNTLVGNDFIGKQLTDFRNAQLTGNTTAEDLRQTIFDNYVSQRDQIARDTVAPLQAEILRQEQLGNKEAVAQLQEQYREIISGMNLEDQRLFFQGSMGQRKDADSLVTAALNRRQTDQTIRHNEENQGWKRNEKQNQQLADAAVVYAVGFSDDPVEQRAAAVEYVSKNGGSPDVLLKVAANLDQASGNILGTSGGTGGGGVGGGQSGSVGGSTPNVGETDTGLTRSEKDAVERLRTDVNTTRAQNQVPVSDAAIQAGTKSDSVPALYESAVERFPSSLGQVSLDEYTRLIDDVMDQYRGLTTNQAATLVEENFRQGRSLWERMDNIPIIGGFIPTFGAKALLPDVGRRAGVHPERVKEAANFLTSPTSRNIAITESQRLRGVDEDLSRGEQILQDLAQKVEAARRHAAITGNYSRLIEAERDLELARDDLMADVNYFYGTDPTNEASQVAADMVLPRFSDPKDPRRTVTRSELRRRNEEADIRNLETIQNRAFAAATIPGVRDEINALESEYVSTPISSPRRGEIMKEIQELRKELERLQELAR